MSPIYQYNEPRKGSHLAVCLVGGPQFDQIGKGLVKLFARLISGGIARQLKIGRHFAHKCGRRGGHSCPDLFDRSRSDSVLVRYSSTARRSLFALNFFLLQVISSLFIFCSSLFCYTFYLFIFFSSPLFRVNLFQDMTYAFRGGVLGWNFGLAEIWDFLAAWGGALGVNLLEVCAVGLNTFCARNLLTE